MHQASLPEMQQRSRAICQPGRLYAKNKDKRRKGNTKALAKMTNRNKGNKGYQK